jgi:membrane protein DedA with SNARE-associated domain/membrane-associated phospholipid phosphatase
LRLEGENRERVRLVAIVAVFLGGFLAFQHFVPNLDIEGFLEDLARELGDWTYALVGLLAFLETGAFVGLVFPGETAVILGGAIAGQGETSIEITIAIVWFCAWAGDSVSFLIGTRLGRDFVMRHGPRVRITHERFAQVEDYFKRHGGKTILIGRFLGLVRALAPFIAGSSGMPYRVFLPYSVLGTGLWSATFCLLGYFVSQSLNEATEIAGTGTLLFGALVGVTIAVIVVVRFMRVRENRQRLARSMEQYRVLRPVVALGRRIEPQVRFLYARLTPGGLGLEFTSLVAVLAVALFVLVGYASIVSVDPGPTPGDETAFDVAADLQAAWLTDVAKVVTSFGSWTATLAVAVVVGIALAVRRHWPELAVLVVAVAILYVAVPALKDAIDRPRPIGGLVETDGSSFPSGHAAYAVIYPWLAVTIAVRLRPGMARASGLIAAGIVLAAAVGLSRVYLRVHFLSDVSAGWGLGVSAFALCAICAMLVPYIERLRQNWAAPDARR